MFKDEDKFTINHFRIAESLKNNTVVHSSLPGTLGLSGLSQYREFPEEYRFQSCTAGVRVLFFSWNQRAAESVAVCNTNILVE